MAASSACAVQSSFGTVIFFTFSPLGAGEGDRDIEVRCWPSKPGTSSEKGLPDISDSEADSVGSVAIAAVVLIVSDVVTSERLSLLP